MACWYHQIVVLSQPGWDLCTIHFVSTLWDMLSNWASAWLYYYALWLAAFSQAACLPNELPLLRDCIRSMRRISSWIRRRSIHRHLPARRRARLHQVPLMKIDNIYQIYCKNNSLVSRIVWRSWRRRSHSVLQQIK